MDVCSGVTSKISISGSDYTTSWLAALSEWLFGLRISVQRESGGQLYGYAGDAAQVCIIYVHKQDGLYIDKTTTAMGSSGQLAAESTQESGTCLVSYPDAAIRSGMPAAGYETSRRPSRNLNPTFSDDDIDTQHGALPPTVPPTTLQPDGSYFELLPNSPSHPPSSSSRLTTRLADISEDQVEKPSSDQEWDNESLLSLGSFTGISFSGDSGYHSASSLSAPELADVVDLIASIFSTHEDLSETLVRSFEQLDYDLVAKRLENLLRLYAKELQRNKCTPKHLHPPTAESKSNQDAHDEQWSSEIPNFIGNHASRISAAIKSKIQPADRHLPTAPTKDRVSKLLENRYTLNERIGLLSHPEYEHSLLATEAASTTEHELPMEHDDDDDESDTEIFEDSELLESTGEILIQYMIQFLVSGDTFRRFSETAQFLGAPKNIWKEKVSAR
jgi:hypothetical protein